MVVTRVVVTAVVVTVVTRAAVIVVVITTDRNPRRREAVAFQRCGRLLPERGLMTQEYSVRHFIRCLALLALAEVSGFAGGACAQNMIPSGTVIPVVLSHTINSQKNKAGQAIVAKVAQDVPLGEKKVIHRNTKVLGEVSQIERSAGRTTVVLRFDRIELGHAQVPISTQLRALADAASVDDAQTPTDVDQRPRSWARTTVQIGGDAVYRGGGPVQSLTGEIVGKPTGCIECGVLDRVSAAAPGPQCAGAVADDTEPQAMWVFSADACGVYGFSNLQFQNGSTISRDGQILLSAHRPIKVPGGTALLLTVAGTQAGAEK